MKLISTLVISVVTITSSPAQQQAADSAMVKEKVVLAKSGELLAQQETRVSVIYVRFNGRRTIDEVLKCKDELFPQGSASLLGPQHFKGGSLLALGEMLLAARQPALVALKDVSSDKMVVGCLLNPNYTLNVSDPTYSGLDEKGRPFKSTGLCYAANLTIDQQKADGPRIRENVAMKLGANIIYNEKEIPAKGDKRLVTFTYVAGQSLKLPGDTFRPSVIDAEYSSCCFIVRSR